MSLNDTAPLQVQDLRRVESVLAQILAELKKLNASRGASEDRSNG